MMSIRAGVLVDVTAVGAWQLVGRQILLNTRLEQKRKTRRPNRNVKLIFLHRVFLIQNPHDQALYVKPHIRTSQTDLRPDPTYYVKR